jgi:hypothetical protein
VPRAELACGRVGDDVDVMVAQPGRPALRLLSGPAVCMAASWCICMAWGFVPPRVMAKVLAPQARATCHGPCTSQSRGELVRGGDLACEAETCRVRQRLVVRGGDLSCEAETCRGGSLLLGTGRRCCQLAGVMTSFHCGSWPGSSAFLVLDLGLDIVNLGLHIVNGVGLPCDQRDLSAVKGGP